ncbi:NAC domain-containing protein 45-like [Panicum miliaceum]|uniref:NAC domain-containing protein 45-like n=1 Tax=Panicum miliaceum TaxID=4540 RepID=A0A3L6QXF6_PANMI|nr:NAC domain-containing protein 45-like [Panicum miliaceum]
MAGSPPRAPPAPFASHLSYPEFIDSFLRPRVVSGEKLKGKHCINRAVDTGEGRWKQQGPPHPVRSNLGDHPPPRIGQRQNFAFVWKEDDKLVRSVRTRWSMVELRRDPLDLLALCKVYRCVSDPKAKADDGSPVAAMARERGGKEAEDEVSAAAGVAAPGREEEDDEEINAETTAGSPGRQKKAVGASAGAAMTGELCDGWRAPLDAAEKAKAPAEAEDVSAMAGSLQKSKPAPFASHPSDAELVNSYLRPWVVSGEKVGEFIHEADIYAAGPDRLTTDLTLNSGAAAASTGRQKFVSESAGAATTLELCLGCGASLDAAEEADTPADAAESEDPSKGSTTSFEIRRSSRKR